MRDISKDIEDFKMNNTTRRTCCKDTLNMYKQLQMALIIASKKKSRENENRDLSIMEILKTVVVQDNTDSISVCSENSYSTSSEASNNDAISVCSENFDTASSKGSKNQDEEVFTNSPFVLGLSAAVMFLEDPLYTEGTNRVPTPSTIIGLSAAGLNAPVVPGPIDELKLMKVRTANALRCLRQHILPNYHLNTEC